MQNILKNWKKYCNIKEINCTFVFFVSTYFNRVVVQQHKSFTCLVAYYKTQHDFAKHIKNNKILISNIFIVTHLHCVVAQQHICFWSRRSILFLVVCYKAFLVYVQTQENIAFLAFPSGHTLWTEVALPSLVTVQWPMSEVIVTHIWSWFWWGVVLLLRWWRGGGWWSANSAWFVELVQTAKRNLLKDIGFSFSRPQSLL